ncbi:MAG TPA: hypothetical protein VL500_07870 [Candidatus Eisenbacteria bacterium]|nr:hypothetical protein [Candidatus Eisenbacteria bacterium]
MKAGIDLGTTAVKIAWRNEDASHGFLSLDHDDDIAGRLAGMGITKLRSTGIGGRPPAGFDASGPSGDPIEDEIAVQADGVRRLFGLQDGPRGDFLLVSIGTGTSYTLVPKEGTPRRFPIGNAIGGGFIAGVAAMQMIDITEIEESAKKGSHLDLLVKDLLPSKAGTLEGEFVVSHFGKLGDPRFVPERLDRESDPVDDHCATIVHCAAVTVIRDALILGMIPGFAADDIVFIGTPVAKLTALRGHLERFAAMLGRRAHFPERGEYAAALGALYAD